MKWLLLLTSWCYLKCEVLGYRSQSICTIKVKKLSATAISGSPQKHSVQDEVIPHCPQYSRSRCRLNRCLIKSLSIACIWSSALCISSITSWREGSNNFESIFFIVFDIFLKMVAIPKPDNEGGVPVPVPQRTSSHIGY